MTICIIAEKPSVARDIARIVGANNKQDGYLQGGGYLVTWAMGHLITLAMPEAYGYGAYKSEELPIRPNPFQLIVRQVSKGKEYSDDPAALKQLKANTLGSRTIDEGSMDEDSGMNFSEYVAVLSGNTDLVEKAKLDKKITALESERKSFLKERDAASGKLAEIEHSVAYHTGRVEEAKRDLATFESRIQRDAEGNPINKLVLKGVDEGADEGADIKVLAARLQEIEEKARTNGEHHKIGEIYGFPITVKTESSTKDLFTLSVNRFFVRGEGSIYYTYNNGKLASDPKLACANFVNALERIPKVIESHEKEVAKAKADIGVYTVIANGSWKKEDELRLLKTQAAELDRKISLELAPPGPEKEEVKEGEKQELSQGAEQNTTSLGAKQESAHTLSRNTTTSQSPMHAPKSEQVDRSVMSRIVISKPKWR